MNNLRKRILTLLFALAMVVTFMPLTTFTAYGAAGDEPAHSKSINDNEDGTYKLELSVTGDALDKVETAANVNVIVVYDTSSSMTRYRSNGGNSGPYRADAAEKIIYDFVGDLFKYEKEATEANPDPDNIQLTLIQFDHTAKTVINWNDSNDEELIQSKLSATGNSGSRKLTYNSGTNWESAMLAAETMLGRADDDPTFVIFITDGLPSQKADTPEGTYYNISGQGANPEMVRTCAQAAMDPARRMQNQEDTEFFGIYAYGDENDYLDDVVYYAHTGSHRNPEDTAIVNTGIEDYYFNATNTSAIGEAIKSIFKKIVNALGISKVSVSDGTTNQVTTSSGEIAELLEVDESSYEYWLSIPIVNNKFTRVDPVTGEETEYTVSADGKTVSWGTGADAKSVTVNGKITNNELKYKWTGANDLYEYAPPAAHLNPDTGAVDWNLSSVGPNGTLLSGVTYSVTFDVYPSQTTLDDVADIKNDPGADGAWADLDPEVQKYIDVNGNLKTNTTATLTYSDTRLDEPGPKTATYKNPDPVPTQTVEQIAVSKKWDNQLEDDWEKPKSITLDVTRDKDPTYTVTLNNGNNWTGNVYISIGIIKDGVVLDGAEGHDYTFAEPQIAEGFKWELDVPTVRPMLIDGGGKDKTPTMLVKVDEKHPAPTGATTYEIEGSTYYVGDASVALTATNVRRASVNVTKAVDGEDAPEDAVFPWTINVVNKLAPATAPENDPGHDSDYWVWISVWDKDGKAVTSGVSGATHASETSSWYYAPSGTDITVQVKEGYSIRLNNLPVGSTYTITEGDMPTGFTFDPDEEKTETHFIEGDTDQDEWAELTIDEENKSVTGTVDTNNVVYLTTLTNKYSLADVEVTKVWDDNSDQDGFRPKELELTLNGAPEGTTIPKPTITKSEDGNSWVYKWTGLPRFGADGKTEIKYTVTEETVPEKYTCETTTVEDKGTITNVHTPETINIPVKKVWVGPAGDEVTVTLYADGKATDKSVKLNADNEWKNEFKNLPVYDAGKEIKYSVVEAGVTGVDTTKYTVTIEGKADATGYTITNTNTETVDIEVTKAWDDNSNQDGVRPTDLTLTLKADGKAVSGSTPTITKSGDNWTYKWTGLPKYTDAGAAITYTVTEETVPENYTCETTTVSNKGTITNVHEPATIDIPVEKIWKGPAGDEVTVTLYADGEKTDKSVKLNADNEWKNEFKNLPVNKAGEPIEYTLEEESVEGVDSTKYTVEIEGDAENGFTITNTNTETVDIEVTKAWDDNSNQDGVRPTDLTLTLKADGKAVSGSTPTITKSGDNWTYKWTGLPKYTDAGAAITYTVTEETVPENYTCETTTVSNKGTITNVHEPKKTNIPVKKVWVGPAGDEVTVTLYADGKATDKSVKLNADNQWKNEFKNLPVYRDGGTEIIYSVVEAGVSGVDTTKYKVTIEGKADATGYTITNTNTETVDIEVTKKWVDGSNQDGVRPTDLELTLNGAPEGTTVPDPTITKSGNNWVYKWTGLPKYAADGTAYTYTVSEDSVPEGYEVSGTPAQDKGTITNTHETKKTSIPVKKVWKGPAGDEVTVVLYADGEATSNTVKLNKSNDWEGEFKNLPVYRDGGTEIVYSVVEAGVSGVDKDKYTVTITGDPESGFTITNTNTEKVSSKVTKEWLNDNDNNRPESITVELYADDESTGTTKTLNAGNSWTETVTGLAKYTEEGSPITYTWKESGLPEYYAEVGNKTEKTDAGFETIITNKRFDSVDVTLKGTKELVGRNLKDGEFTFIITGPDNYKDTATNKDGKFSFGPFTFDTPGTYEYTIVEDNDKLPERVAENTQSFTATIKVTANKDKGVFEATVNGLDQKDFSADFINIYEPKNTSATIVGEKILKGDRKLEEGEFTFKITGKYEPLEGSTKKEEAAPEAEKEEEEPVVDTADDKDEAAEEAEKAAEEAAEEAKEAKEEAADAAADLEAAEKALAEAEEKGDEAEVEAAEKAVEETEAVAGEAKADAEEAAEAAEEAKDAVPADNDEQPAAEEAVNAEGDEDEAEDDEVEVPMPESDTASNEANGKVDFGTIEFSAEGIYTYTITEDTSSLPLGVECMSDPQDVVIVVKYDKDKGEFYVESITPKTAPRFSFTNKYTPVPGEGSVSVMKQFEGHDLSEGDFEFALIEDKEDGKTVAVAKNDADGKVTFKNIKFTKAGTYDYKIVELKGDSSAITYDGSIKYVTATVTDNFDGEPMTVEWSGDVDGTFINDYYDEVYIDPPVTKVVKGKPKKAETYTFLLEADDPENPMPEAADGDSSMTMTIKGAGTKEFGKIVFTEPGEYSYTVTEVKGSNSKCKYDGSVYTVTAYVTEDPDTYELSVRTVYEKNGQVVDTATFLFTNTYEGENPPPDNPDTGDTNDLAGLLGLMGTSAAGLVYMFFRRRREEAL